MPLLIKKKRYTTWSTKKIYNSVAERTGEIEKLHNSFNFRNLIYHFEDPNKDIDFNDFINAETYFDDIKFKRIRFEDVKKKKKNQMEFESKLNSVKLGGNKSYKQLKEIKNITKLLNRERRLLNFTVITLKWFINPHMIQNMEKVWKY